MPPRPKKSDGRNPLAGYHEIDRQLRGSSVPKPPLSPSPVPGADDQRHFDDLRDVATSLGAAVDLTDALDRIVDGILQVARCERGFVILSADDGSFATYTGRLRDRGTWEERDARQISATIVNRVAASHQPFIVSDVDEIADLRERGSILEGKIRAAVCLPLLHDQRLIGVIYADNSFVTPQYTEWDRGALQIFGIQASFSIENARRQGELKDRGDRLAEENRTLARHLAREFALGGMISRNREMLGIFETVDKIAPSDTRVLILGESGTGKELLARAIHDKSTRRGRPFQALNCAGIPSELVESTLFGFVKGAFTSADMDRPGMFEAANGGTLFLDEIGDMPMTTQPKLLRVLQEKEFSRVGEVRVRPVDVRIISATNLDLERAVADGEFREDLFYRLNGVTIDLPPLRNRREDIIPLAEYFLDRYAKEKDQPRPQLAADAKALLLSYTWPGNVRRLESVIETAIAFQDGDRIIHARQLERSLQGRERNATVETGSLRELIDRYEEQIVRRTLVENDNNVTNAAKALDLSRQQLYNKIRKYRINLRPE
jgi:Nif-specific regulatory protein